MSEKKEIPEWIKRALTELQQHMTDDPLYATGKHDELIWWASEQFADQAAPIIAKHALDYSDEDVERLVRVSTELTKHWTPENNTAVKMALKSFHKEK